MTCFIQMRYRYSRLPFCVAFIFIAMYFLMIPLLLHFTMSEGENDADDHVDDDDDDVTEDDHLSLRNADLKSGNDQQAQTAGKIKGEQKIAIHQENTTEERGNEADLDIATNKDVEMNSEIQPERDGSRLIDVTQQQQDVVRETVMLQQEEKVDENLMDKVIDNELDETVAEMNRVLSAITNVNIHVDQITNDVDKNSGRDVLAEVNLYNNWERGDDFRSYTTSSEISKTETAEDNSYFTKGKSIDHLQFMRDKRLNRANRDTSLPKSSNQNISVFDINFESNETVFRDWVSNSQVHCEGSLIYYANLFIHTSDIILDPTKVIGARGGENITDVLEQSESIEFLDPSPGIFRLPCSRIPSYRFKQYSDGNDGHIAQFLSATLSQEGMSDTITDFDVEENMTIMLVRYEYANLFHSLNDIFNVFLLCVFFHENPADVNILIMDGHPWGKIDPVWDKLFGNVTRVGHLTRPVNYHSLVWSMFEKHSPLNDHSLESIPHLMDFRTFVLESYGVEGKLLAECSDRMNFLVVLRRDYLAHPRNPSGVVQRKIKNENEIIEGIQRIYPHYNVVGCDLASMDFKQQLEIVANSDIIVGMHGAGLTHVLFMPDGGGLVELVQYESTINDKQSQLFSQIAKWKNFSYSRWRNNDKALNLSDGYTYIPTEIILGLLNEQVKRICQ